MTKVLIAKSDTFTKLGRYVYRGQPLAENEVDYDPDNGSDTHLIEAPDGFNDQAVVEVSAIAPTGPNPQNPQQIAPDVRQTEAGYVQAGARLVGEVTKPAKTRIEMVGIDPEDDTQAKVTEALDKASPNAAIADGTVADMNTRIDATRDADGLRRLRAAEEQREKPRKGVLDAIDARLKAL